MSTHFFSLVWKGI